MEIEPTRPQPPLARMRDASPLLVTGSDGRGFDLHVQLTSMRAASASARTARCGRCRGQWPRCSVDGRSSIRFTLGRVNRRMSCVLPSTPPVASPSRAPASSHRPSTVTLCNGRPFPAGTGITGSNRPRDPVTAHARAAHAARPLLPPLTAGLWSCLRASRAQPARGAARRGAAVAHGHGAWPARE